MPACWNTPATVYLTSCCLDSPALCVLRCTGHTYYSLLCYIDSYRRFSYLDTNFCAAPPCVTCRSRGHLPLPALVLDRVPLCLPSSRTLLPLYKGFSGTFLPTGWTAMPTYTYSCVHFRFSTHLLLRFSCLPAPLYNSYLPHRSTLPAPHWFLSADNSTV